MGSLQSKCCVEAGGMDGPVPRTVTQEQVSEQERVSHWHEEQQELGSGLWPGEVRHFSPALHHPGLQQVHLLTFPAWALGGALHAVLGSSWPPAGHSG